MDEKAAHGCAAWWYGERESFWGTEFVGWNLHTVTMVFDHERTHSIREYPKKYFLVELNVNIIDQDLFSCVPTCLCLTVFA